MSAKEKTRGFLSEFRKFVARGNVMDLAVGVIIGGAFQSIVNSLVNDVINPLLGMLTGDSASLAASLTFQLPGGGQLMLGSFINAVINFFIMAFVIFLLVKGINAFHRKKEEAPKAPEPPKPSAEEVLLTEIRDLLKEGRHE